MNKTKRKRLSGEYPATIMVLPDDLQLEILTYVPARELTRCKSVCKLWKSLIGSPPFLPLYRRRNRCLLAYWAVGGRIHFHYSPIRRHRMDPEERFRRLGSLPVGRMPVKGPELDPLTQPVNGVIVSGVTADGGGSSGREPEVELKVISVATGQALRVPPPLPRDYDTKSSYSLGYDPRSRRYKLLRLIFRVRNGNLLTGMGMEADVITLGPFSSVWEWRKLDGDGAGIRRLPLRTSTLNYAVAVHEARMFSGDGVLCWLCKDDEGVILFDMDMERFRYVKLPANLQVEGEDSWRTLVPRVRMADEALTIHLWVLPAGEKSKPELECFYLEDMEGKVWRKRSVGLRRELHDSLRWLGVVNGSPLPDSSIVLMSCTSDWEGQRRDVYLSNGMRRFWVGQLRDRTYFNYTNDLRMRDSFVRLSCLLDSNVLYLSLIDVLNGNGLV